MCGAIKFHHGNTEMTVYFPNPTAALPVRLKSGGHGLIRWGRRNDEPGMLPAGGWARYDSVLDGAWDKYFPKPVLITAGQFMEKDRQGKSHWYTLAAATYIQGLIARDGDEQRIYVVTIDTDNGDHEDIHECWPRIVNAL
jgi:hypothetical protein